VKATVREPLSDERSILLFLRSWWSKTYNRPLKDPILTSYTLQELLYEYFEKTERILAEKERTDADSDKIEEENYDAALAWAEEEERKELEALAAKEKKPVDPLKDPNNLKWMEEQMKKAKEVYGNDFGEDIVEVFE
jgi:hypothetical protein